eukprot:jgi/Mesen1/8272/ME000448S07415
MGLGAQALQYAAAGTMTGLNSSHSFSRGELSLGQIEASVSRVIVSSAPPSIRCLTGDVLGEHNKGGFLGQSRVVFERTGLQLSNKTRRNGMKTVSAIRKTKRAPMDPDYPWPEKIKDDQGFLSFLSKFTPVPDRINKPVTLPFERPLVDLESKIDEVRELAKKTGMDFGDQVQELESKYEKLKRDIYQRLTPVQRLSVARHPNRPTFLDHVINMSDKWVELHGDRGGYDDPALVCGIARIDGMSFMLMGHQKGRNTKENIQRNFGMPTPNGYRKALRLMRHADKFGFPIIMFIDTPGAFCAVETEKIGQGEAIAHNLREMFGLKVPTLAIVIGEGGSGGALAVGCCNKMLMLENAVYFVASPEACAAILWKTASAAPKATEALRITGYELQKLNVVDEVIPEPLGGAHADPMQASLNIKEVIMRNMRELLAKTDDEILDERVAKFRKVGGIMEGVPVDPRKQRNMKKSDVPSSQEKLLPSNLRNLAGPAFDTFSSPEVNNTPVKSLVE